MIAWKIKQYRFKNHLLLVLVFLSASTKLPCHTYVHTVLVNVCYLLVRIPLVLKRSKWSYTHARTRTHAHTHTHKHNYSALPSATFIISTSSFILHITLTATLQLLHKNLLHKYIHSRLCNLTLILVRFLWLINEVVGLLRQFNTNQLRQ